MLLKIKKNLGDIFDFSNLDENHELFGNKIKKMIGKFKIETPTKIWIEEFLTLRSKGYAFKCGDDSKKKLKVFSKIQTKNIKIVEYKFCLDGEKSVNECENYILKSINRDMYLQKIRRTKLSIFVDKRNYLNSIESLPWT